MQKKVDKAAFIADFTAGVPEPLLMARHNLSGSELVRVMKALNEMGAITPAVIAQRAKALNPVSPKKVDTATGLVLHCPGCGAAVARDVSECAHCASVLDFTSEFKGVRCASCFRRTPVGGRYCVMCGAPVPRRKSAGESSEVLTCPGCATRLVSARCGDVPLHECAACGGEFLSHESFTAIRAKIENLAMSLNMRRKELSPDRVVKYLKCPQCAGVMNRQNLGRISGVIADVCPKHGIWFDKGELDPVLDFIVRGGFKKSAELEKRRLKDEADYQKARAKWRDASAPADTTDASIISAIFFPID
jgi:Zn-finger nucleic acid-binding protein